MFPDELLWIRALSHFHYNIAYNIVKSMQYWHQETMHFRNLHSWINGFGLFGLLDKIDLYIHFEGEKFVLPFVLTMTLKSVTNSISHLNAIYSVQIEEENNFAIFHCTLITTAVFPHFIQTNLSLFIIAKMPKSPSFSLPLAICPRIVWL